MRSVGFATQAREHLGLDRVDLECEALDHLAVVVDDAVGDGVEHRARPDAQEVRVRLEIEPYVVQRAALAMADGDDETRAREDHDLADLHRLGAVDVARRLEHEEQRVAEYLELRPLVGVDGVLDRQRMELEALAHRLDDLGAGVMETDPDEAVVACVGLAERGLEVDLAALTVALVVDGAVDDGRPDVHVHARRVLAVRGGAVTAEQRDPGQAVGRHAATIPPQRAAGRASSRDLDPAARDLHTPLTGARLAWPAC